MKKLVCMVIIVSSVFSTADVLAARKKKSKPQSPNFVVILTDDQSWVGTSTLMKPDDLRSRSDYYQTPGIDRLAQMGMRFSRGYSPAPFCCPTRRSLLIGQTPARHIYQRDRENWPKDYRKQLTIPRMLKQADPEYVTAHFGKWDLRTDEPVPEDMGYDVSDGYTNNQTGGGKSSGGMEPVDDPKLVYSVTKRACDFIETQAQRNKPFYLQVSHYAVHLAIFYSQASLDECSNFQPGKKHTMPEFAAMTSDLDNGIAALIDKIADLGLTNNTYIFFMSDNGGRYDMPGQKNKQLPRNDPLRQGKGTMYEGGIRVPFVIAGPGVKPAVVSDVPVSGLDILPTLADLAGYDQPLPKALDGGSLRNVISNAGKGRVKRNNPFMIFHHAVDRSPQTAIIRDPFKLVKTWEDDQLELFDLSKDIGEENDLSEKMPAKTRDLHDQMTSFLKKVNAETAWTKK